MFSTTRRFQSIVLGFAVTIAGLCLAHVPMATVLCGENAVRFNTDVRPILSENCYYCHGPDEQSRQAGLRLDTEQDAKEYAVVSGDADASELYLRMTSEDLDVVMPPPDSERSLSQAQIETIRRWIDQGAPYQGHWAFEAPKRGEVPAWIDGYPPHNVIDRFVQTRLAEQGRTQSLEADRETLIRRVTFDLLGLPPTLQQIDDFLGDTSDDAYEQLLDRLLAQKEFAERMTADWLDVARYSDTYGYQVDRDRYVWPWRDWVIEAFHRNMPYDRFLTLQLAGDLLPNASPDQILATTFNRLHPQKVEGGSVPEEFRIEYIADRTQTVATAIMGLTMECCRCHNHKYDPLSQKEYFEFSAFFDNIDEAGLYSYFTDSVPTPALPLPTEQQQQQLVAALKELDEAKAAYWEAMDEQTSAAKSWADQPGAGLDDGALATPVLNLTFEENVEPPNQTVSAARGMGVRLTGDDPINTTVGNFHRYDPFSVSCWIKTPDVKPRAVIFHRSRAWTDAASRGYELLLDEGRLSWSLIHFWPGNAISIRTVDPIPTGKWMHVVVTNEGSSRASGLRIYVEGVEARTEIVRDALTKQITGGGEAGDHITIGERFRDRGFKNGEVDEFSVYDCQLSRLEIRMLASVTQTKSVDPLADELVEHYLARLDETVRQARLRMHESRKSLCAIEDSLQEIMVMRELPEPRPSYLLARGSYDQPVEQVYPGTPQVLPPFPSDAPRNRLGLAQWLTDPNHPLTSRVAVNRFWQICFGVGLVRTPEDFGSQGIPPTHAELLDWLAVDFMESGWDVKASMKQIMMSATYRQSSQPSDATGDRLDPENRLLARFPAYRLPAEMLRDNVLAISGRLVATVGGPPVKPYEIEESFKPSKHDSGDSLYRRSLYTYWKRTAPAPSMVVLDAAKRDVCQVRRERTSSPLQAFVLWNSPQFVEASRVMAQRLISQHGKEVDQILVDAFRLTTSRRPSPIQLQTLQKLYRTQRDDFVRYPKRVEAFLAIGEADNEPGIDPPALAATAVVIGTLMNFDLSVMKR
ncbi:DUF1553 domain-containing protein [Novipirellula artificiosorum]|uniref:Planctomycete cytochrome C n=1 Tax=Novipirellula artificiosorum TaxID=2528016 RepID=A0A5C6DLT9_9BACT|nr:DUF1553 domain-containing protein [Novipirellula artificiosorum]TWU35886.1 Planctomycete cytochrome C [Novipirellula artificiosorum]